MNEGLTDWLIEFVPQWGPYVVGLSTFLSCLLMPLPSSVLLIAAGAFVAAGDLSLWAVAAAALAGYAMGDQVGFSIGRLGRARLRRYAGRGSGALGRARRLIGRYGLWAVFVSRWLVSPLAPWVTLGAGAGDLARLRFTGASLPGAVIWVALYLGLGMLFGQNLAAATELAGSALGLIAALGLTVALGLWLLHNARRAPDG
ncbi:MAG: VTT domain-containing protein [Paracoccus sp. (in: a-proteobacteria)]|nr:VTT domain-containing protein [Paracoccus sp. (in: a-proteobacteria)]